MKRILILGIIIALAVGGIFFIKPTKKTNEVYYLNAYDMMSYAKLQKLSSSLRDEGYKVVVSGKDNFKSGKFNLYATSSFENLPPVLDNRAINLLWLPHVEQNNLEVLRRYDVIVVETMPSFSHLKAVNVRTAFIPPAIDIKQRQKNPELNQAMYYGNNNTGFSLSLYLAGPTDLKVDVYGKGFHGYWNEKEIKEEPVKDEDFQRYAVVMVDQSEEDIRDEVVNRRIIDVIEKGGLPYVRYNSGIAKLFGESVPMYMSEAEFLPLIKQILANPDEIDERKNAIRMIAKNWSLTMQAQKFIELFEVMNKKRL